MLSILGWKQTSNEKGVMYRKLREYMSLQKIGGGFVITIFSYLAEKMYRHVTY